MSEPETCPKAGDQRCPKCGGQLIPERMAIQERYLTCYTCHTTISDAVRMYRELRARVALLEGVVKQVLKGAAFTMKLWDCELSECADNFVIDVGISAGNLKKMAALSRLEGNDGRL